MKEKKRYKTPKLPPETIRAIEDKVYELAEIIVSANYFVVEVTLEEENGRWYLRIYLDHPNPTIRITLDDCKDISEALSPMIDENVPELADFSYNLEVSSPGLFRALAKPRELQFYQGRRIEIVVKGQQPFIAYLKGFDIPSSELVYAPTADPEAEVIRLAWNPKTVKVSLSPDLTEKIETQTVPRRITRYD